MLHDEDRASQQETDDIPIPPDTFTNNPKLKFFRLDVRTAKTNTVILPETLFANNPELDELILRTTVTVVPRDTFKELHKLNYLYLGDDPHNPQELQLSQHSPLYKRITLEGEIPWGYTIPPTPEKTREPTP